MSMLSAQVDELRELALWLDDKFYDEYATRARDAADTVLALRDKAQELQADNAKLRGLVWDMWDFYCVMPDEPHAFKEELDFSVEVWKRMRELGWKWTDD